MIGVILDCNGITLSTEIDEDEGIEMQSSFRNHLRHTTSNISDSKESDENEKQAQEFPARWPESHLRVMSPELLHFLNFSDCSLWSSENNTRYVRRCGCVVMLYLLSRRQLDGDSMGEMVDKKYVRNPLFFPEPLEIRHDPVVKADRNLGGNLSDISETK
jgi:hypothetical protein